MAGVLDWIGGAGIPIVSGVADAIAGNANAKAARDAFKSRYQDTVRDMRKAGLNPALAYGQGGGSPQTHDLPLPGEQVAKAGQMFSAAGQARANRDLTKAQTELLLAQKADLIDQIRLRNAQIFTETATSGAQGGLAMKQQQQVEMAIQNMRYDQMYQKATLEDRVKMVRQELTRKGIDIDAGRIQNILNRLDIPRRKSEANFYGGIGKGSPYLNSAAQLLSIIRGR